MTLTPIQTLYTGAFVFVITLMIVLADAAHYAAQGV
ncbi:hypothetical protein MXMO3_01671 [Maritalea myrionectae]|uniref:Uncharacterized protein n=1 Tax=Maritalea myrionectae TaxID=454601 RepID=A0A2R4MDT6_9HYPH|nr:hypothetical protein MXMO3_01671 [Maritalea myrionectae]